MSAIALVGALTMAFNTETFEKFLLPIVSLAAGTLLGGAFFHMLPAGMRALDPLVAAVWLMAGFTAFLALEQFFHWHESHDTEAEGHRPVAYLILLGDAIHNFIGGIAVCSTFLIDPRAGLVAWCAAAAHEVPQEFGDFAILVRGGFSPRKALVLNFATGLTFLVGGIVAYFTASQLEIAPLVLLGAGNFIYIAASDLVPEIKSHRGARSGAVHFALFLGGLALTLVLAQLFHAH